MARPQDSKSERLFAHATRTVEEILALLNQVLIEKFLSPHASVIASN